MRSILFTLLFVFTSVNALAQESQGSTPANEPNTSDSSSQEEPQVVVKSAADRLLSDILENKEKVDTDTGYLASLIEQHLIPVVDQEYMSRVAMGKQAWQSATDEQKQAFTVGFRKLLIKTYAGAFRSYNGQEVTYSKTRISKDGRKAKVASSIVLTAGNSIDIEYRLLKGKQTSQWKVVDAMVAGLALLKTYRIQFAEQIKNEGLDKTIAMLQNTQL